MRRRSWRYPPPVIAALLGVVAFGDTAQADTVLVGPARDATLIESPSGTLANGAGPHLFAGRTGSFSGSIRRALLAFDLAGSIPPGSVVTGVRLSLHLSQTNAGPSPLTLHRLLGDWSEGPSFATGGGGGPALPGDVTWIHARFDDRPWNTPGGDFDPRPRATALVDDPGYWSWGGSPELIADVQSWLLDPAAAHGWIVLGDETAPTTVKRFDSREHPDPGLRPILTIDYEPSCEPRYIGPGYWHRQCLVIASAGIGSGLPALPGTGGPVPAGPIEPGFGELILPCAGALIANAGIGGIDPCAMVAAAPRAGSCTRAGTRLATLAFNLCADRLQTSCSVPALPRVCAADDVGGLFALLVEAIRTGTCDRTAVCAGEPVSPSDGD